jgi:hypothetical protein
MTKDKARQEIKFLKNLTIDKNFIHAKTCY